MAKKLQATVTIYWSHLEYPGGFFVPMRHVRRRRRPRHNG